MKDIGVLKDVRVFILLGFLSIESARAEGDPCRRDSDCTGPSSSCATAFRMCLCTDRSMSYPDCKDKEVACEESCSERMYCDKVSQKCVCMYGDPNSEECCDRACEVWEVCSNGKCNCRHGQKNGRCRRCPEQCASGFQCKKSTDGSYRCVRTKCEPGESLVLGNRCISDWSAWGSWSTCSVTCGRGFQQRTRVCSTNKCPGDSREVIECDKESCFGTWKQWSEWTKCTAECGSGVRLRRRECSKPNQCLGDAQELDICTSKSCVAVGTWLAWEAWSDCSCSCGCGVRTRSRNCSNGQNCAGDPKEISNCNTNQCIPTMFDCSRTKELTTTGIIPYQRCTVDTTENAMNANTGVFTIGKGQAGIYEISFTAKFNTSMGSTGWCDIVVNDKVVADFQRQYNGPAWRELSTHTMYLLHPLRENDSLKVLFNRLNMKDSIHSDADNDVHFTAKKVSNLL